MAWAALHSAASAADGQCAPANPYSLLAPSHMTHHSPTWHAAFSALQVLSWQAMPSRRRLGAASRCRCRRRATAAAEQLSSVSVTVKQRTAPALERQPLPACGASTAQEEAQRASAGAAEALVAYPAPGWRPSAHTLVVGGEVPTCYIVVQLQTRRNGACSSGGGGSSGRWLQQQSLNNSSSRGSSGSSRSHLTIWSWPTWCPPPRGSRHAASACQWSH